MMNNQLGSAVQCGLFTAHHYLYIYILQSWFSYFNAYTRRAASRDDY